jgi:fructuronate reductase
MRLSAQTAARLPADIARPHYDRTAQASGIVHFGIGAFHRAHQAIHADDAMNRGERDWAITGVSLRSSNVADQLNPQDGHYLLATRSPDGEDVRLVGSVARVLTGSTDSAAIIAAIAAPTTHIISFTITEKGYGRTGDGGLDPALCGAGSIYPLLSNGLAQRRAANLPGLTFLSCDNISGNGAQLKRLLLTYLESRDADLARWVADECRFPSTLVDRIVPATTAADIAAMASRTGLTDLGLICTERFTQWVIEDDFAGPRPDYAASGVQLVADAAPWEAAKLRMLNGAHSALAYLGLERGHAFVHQAVADPAIRPLIERLMLNEAAPTLPAIPGFDPQIYAADLLARFTNSALPHSLKQVAMDGSQKVPPRWLETLAINTAAGRESPAIEAALAAWLRHSRGDNGPVDDPLSGQLQQLWAQSTWADALARLWAPAHPMIGGTMPPATLSRLAAMQSRL